MCDDYTFETHARAHIKENHNILQKIRLVIERLYIIGYNNGGKKK